MTLLQLLKTGAVLRYRPGFRFYAVQQGREMSRPRQPCAPAASAPKAPAPMGSASTTSLSGTPDEPQV